VRRAILFGLLQSALACAPSTSTAAAIQDDAAFEAALQAAAPAPRAAPREPYVMLGVMEKPGALPGTIPTRWRALHALPADLDPLEADVAEGRLDPAALMTQIAGPLPIPTGASPAGCARWLTAVTYTLGEDLSPAYDALVARGWRAELAEVVDRASIDAHPIRAKLHDFLLRRGFALVERSQNRAAYHNRQTHLRVDVEDSSTTLQRACDCEAKTIHLPTGPVMTINLERE
jgi:hypothetical protein